MTRTKRALLVSLAPFDFYNIIKQLRVKKVVKIDRLRGLLVSGGLIPISVLFVVVFVLDCERNSAY